MVMIMVFSREEKERERETKVWAGWGNAALRLMLTPYEHVIITVVIIAVWC